MLFMIRLSIVRAIRRGGTASRCCKEELVRQRRWFAGGIAVALIASAAVLASTQQVDAKNPPDCDDRSAAVRNNDLRCVVQFGLAGEPWDPAGPAGGGVTRDRNQPSLISIRSGTTVEFQNSGTPHRISIYDHGIGGATTFLDVTGTVVSNVIQPNANPGETLVGPLPAGQSTSYKFDEPGQYLVICAFNPHFRNFGQATFVVVDETVTEAP